MKGGWESPQVTATQVINPATIVVTANTMTDIPFGTQVWNVCVTNLDGVYLILPDAFTITLGM